MTLLIYGAYGYTGELIAREALDRGIDIIVAGRSESKARELGTELGTESRVFEAEDAAEHLDDVDVLLNCAGPFIKTYEPLVEACLDTATPYLDITGELGVFEAIAEHDRKAEDAGIPLLPGVGFDVVPTDCLAGHLHDRLPGATELTLGFDTPSRISGGTAASMLEYAGGGGKVRKNGTIESVPVAANSRTIDFGAGPTHAITIPWGDISTAYYTTGIENIEVYMAVPENTKNLLRASDAASPLLKQGPIKRGLQSLARRFVNGPSERDRETKQTFVWGEATDGETTVTSRLLTPETYALTVDAATTAAGRVLDGADIVGYQTPATAFDPEFVLELDGVEGFFDESFPPLVEYERLPEQ